MDRKEALEILGLNENATADDINKRVDMLVRKFKHVTKDSKGRTLLDVENAYRVLSGITYKDEKAEQEKNYRKAHPNPIFKLLKVDEEKARNFIYYYKWHALVAVIALALIISMVVNIVNRVDPDLRVLVTGKIYVADTVAFEDRIKREIPDITTPQVQNVYLSETNDPQMEMAMQTKFTVELAAGKNDIYILDEENYVKLAKQGVFKPIKDVIGGYENLSVDQSLLEDLEVTMEIEDGNTYTPELYGLDVTDSSLLKDLGLMGERFIVSIGHTGEYFENAVKFLKLLLD